MIPPNNLEHAEAEAFSNLMRQVVAAYYTGPARVQTSAMVNPKGQLCMAVKLTPVKPGAGPNLRMAVQMIVEDSEPPESWKES